MTDEEMAEQYANENKIIFEYQGMSDFVWQELKEACLAGLKAGRPKWHKVADGDLPKDDIKLAIIEIDDCGYLLCNYRNGFWCDANSGATCAEWITNNIIAWKEIVLPELADAEKRVKEIKEK